MGCQVAQSAVSGRDDLKVEAFVEGAWAKLRPRQGLGDPVIEPVGIGFAQSLLDAEQIFQRLLEPNPGGGAAEQAEMLGEQPPDRPSIGLRRGGVPRRDAQRLQRDALRVEHAKDVVIGLNEERRRVLEGGVAGVPLRVGVPMRRNQGQVRHRLIEPARNGARAWVDRQQPVGMKSHACGVLGLVVTSGEAALGGPEPEFSRAPERLACPRVSQGGDYPQSFDGGVNTSNGQ